MGRRSVADNSTSNSAIAESKTSTASELEQLSTRVQEISESTPGGWTAWLESNLSAHQREQLMQLLCKTSSKEAVGNNTVPEPSRRALKLVTLNTAIPFVGFGFLDNSILIVAGDAIDTSLGVLLGISTMCAAALGNIISDVAGIALGTAIEDFCVNTLRLPSPDLTNAQRQLRSVRFASQWGCCIGVVIGCFFGMFPLLWIDSNKIQARKREAHLDQLFRDVVTSAGSLVGAARTSLFLLVNDPQEEKEEGSRVSNKEGQIVSRQASSASPRPVPDGKYLYVKVIDTAKTPTASASSSSTASSSSSLSWYKQEQWIPLGRGIVSRAILTGESWNIRDVDAEPDFVPEIGYVDYQNQSVKTQTMIVVPVMDSSGRPIAVIQAINKVGRGREDDNGDSSDASNKSNTATQTARPFSDSDVQILKALATHISVSLQRISEEAEGDQAEMRLKDTVRLLHDYGLAGLETSSSDNGSGLANTKLARRPLFPEDK